MYVNLWAKCSVESNLKWVKQLDRVFGLCSIVAAEQERQAHSYNNIKLSDQKEKATMRQRANISSLLNVGIDSEQFEGLGESTISILKTAMEEEKKDNAKAAGEALKQAVRRMNNAKAYKLRGVREARKQEKVALGWLKKNDALLKEAEETGKYGKWLKHLSYEYSEMGITYAEWEKISCEVDTIKKPEPATE